MRLIFYLLQEWEDLAETVVSNIQATIHDVWPYVDKLGGEATCWPEYTSRHETLKKSRLFRIAKSVKRGTILLAGVHDSRIVRVIEPKPEIESDGTGIAGPAPSRSHLGEVAADADAIRDVADLRQLLGLRNNCWDASAAWTFVLFRQPFGRRFVPNGTGVITPASVSLHLRDLKRPTFTSGSAKGTHCGCLPNLQRIQS